MCIGRGDVLMAIDVSSRASLAGANTVNVLSWSELGLGMGIGTR